MFECVIAHRRYVAVLCMLYKIWCNPLHPLNDALPIPYVPVRVTRGALVENRYTYAPPCCRTSQYRRTFVHPIGIEQGRCFFIALSCSIPIIVFYYFSLSLLSLYWLVLWGWGLRTDRVYITLSLALPASFNNNNNNKKNNSNNNNLGIYNISVFTIFLGIYNISRYLQYFSVFSIYFSIFNISQYLQYISIPLCQ